MNAPPLPPVTVLMAVHNGARYLDAAIDSVLAQTHRDFQFVIIDDGSTDATPDILRRTAARDTRIEVARRAHAGQAAALNAGLAHARYAWVAIADHDDISLPNRLERQLAAITRDPRVRVLGGWALEINARGDVIGRLETGPTTPAAFEALRAASELVVLTHSSVMLHRDTVLRLGGYSTDMPLTEDIDLWSRVADEHLVLALPEHLVQYRLHPDSKSQRQFMRQRRAMRWTQARQAARRRGAPQPTLAEFAASEAADPAVVRLRRARVDLAACLARRSFIAWGNNIRLRGLVLLGLGFALDPARMLRRARGRFARRRRLGADQ